jgi:hypothetical protein
LILYLGTHMTGWLRTAGFPLMVSHRRLRRRKALPVAAAPWVLDSGGFTELGLYGAWQTDVVSYARAVRRYRDEVGRLEWAAPQDWMCEPFMLAKTGLTVPEHQRRTVRSFLDLRSLGVPVVPVLQGWTLDEYLYCVERYMFAGVELEDEPVVGLGSVCRRQDSHEIEAIVERLHGIGLRLHGFGVKAKGIDRYADMLDSSDSMAWSAEARHWANKGHRTPGHTHRACNSCLPWATRWRARMLRKLESSQLRMALGPVENAARS